MMSHILLSLLFAHQGTAIIEGMTTTKLVSPQKPRVLVIGGSGRVGGSAVRHLFETSDGSLELAVGGRDIQSWNKFTNRVNKALKEHVNFVKMDIFDEASLQKIIPQYDLVIHTAGPFQGLTKNGVLETCLAMGKQYIDVCDDIFLSRTSRSEGYRALARSTGASAVISTGIWPGGSSLFAQKVMEQVEGGKEAVDSVKFSFFTAGSGGAGATILTATFLILGEDVLTYVNNQPVYRKSATDMFTADFGEGIGVRECVRLNLIECESCHVSSGVPNVSTFFGTAPVFWNRLFALMANVIPQNALKNRDLMAKLALVSLPLVRLIDRLVGSTNGIRVDVTSKITGKVTTGLMTHRDLETSVGDSIGAFARQMLKGNVPPGVFFPEEVPNAFFREEVLSEISSDAITYNIYDEAMGPR